MSLGQRLLEHLGISDLVDENGLPLPQVRSFDGDVGVLSNACCGPVLIHLPLSAFAFAQTKS